MSAPTIHYIRLAAVYKSDLLCKSKLDVWHWKLTLKRMSAQTANIMTLEQNRLWCLAVVHIITWCLY